MSAEDRDIIPIVKYDSASTSGVRLDESVVGKGCGVVFFVFAGLNVVWALFFILGLTSASVDYSTIETFPWYITRGYSCSIDCISGCDMYFGLLANGDGCTHNVNQYESCKNDNDYMNGCKNCYKYGTIATIFMVFPWIFCIVSIGSNYSRGKLDSKVAKTITTVSTAITLLCGMIAFSVFLTCANSVSGEQHIGSGLVFPLVAFCGVFCNFLYNLAVPA